MRFRDDRDVKWRVGRRWLPWRRRTKVPEWGSSLDSNGLGDDLISAIIAIVLAVLMLPVLLLALLVGLEFLLLLLLVPVWVGVRVLFGLPWTVVVRRDGKVVHEEQIRGWRASEARIDAIGAQLREGRGIAAIRANR
ncbi:hypothetical protein [Rhodococcus maanshanensis]|uniref:Uncharacterized protein n=1 Tax=Rhodococcus maanshanensis TaxID=183556 RepID=A0A1H7QEM7_9NOCA|nr:hypothetical protein [Rhodococcus maanshanensis]SEL46550.1 hypothetical protein SAMN05444583_109146 [Rhodococcus maanshanensis]